VHQPITTQNGEQDFSEDYKRLCTILGRNNLNFDPKAFHDYWKSSSYFPQTGSDTNHDFIHDLYEKENEVIVCVVMPGEVGLETEFMDNKKGKELLISGTRKLPYHIQGLWEGTFSKVVKLPALCIDDLGLSKPSPGIFQISIKKAEEKKGGKKTISS